MQQVSPNVYVETKCRGCVLSFITTEQGLVMIDSPMIPEDALKWRDEISKRGETRYLINTEHHPDHVTGNFFLSGIIVSSEETRREISVELIRERLQLFYRDELFQFKNYNYEVRFPSITFSERLSLHLGSHTFELINLPGHTLGQTVVYIPEERVLVTGDNVFYKTQIFLHDSDPFQWLKSLKRIEGMDVDVIIPGHGEVCDKSYIPELSSFIQDWINAVRGVIHQGLSKEEAMDRISFLDRYPMQEGVEFLGPEVQRWNTGRLYDLLMREQ